MSEADFPDLPEGTFAQMVNGKIEIINAETGQVLAVQSSKEDLFKAKKDRLVLHRREDGTPVYLEKGLTLSDVHPQSSRGYDPVTMSLICQRVVEGESLTRICGDPAMPSYATICKWRQKHPEADDLLMMAYRDRSEVYHDKALESALLARDKDDAPAQKLKVDTFKWAAQMGNQERFSPRQKIDQNVQVASRIVVETGIRRPGDPGHIEHEVIDAKYVPEICDSSSSADSSSSGDLSEDIFDTGD